MNISSLFGFISSLNPLSSSSDTEQETNRGQQSGRTASGLASQLQGFELSPFFPKVPTQSNNYFSVNRNRLPKLDAANDWQPDISFLFKGTERSQTELDSDHSTVTFEDVTNNPEVGQEASTQKPVTQKRSILPEVWTQRIFSYLNIRDLVKIEAVSKEYQENLRNYLARLVIASKEYQENPCASENLNMRAAKIAAHNIEKLLPHFYTIHSAAIKRIAIERGWLNFLNALVLDERYELVALRKLGDNNSDQDALLIHPQYNFKDNISKFKKFNLSVLFNVITDVPKRRMPPNVGTNYAPIDIQFSDPRNAQFADRDVIKYMITGANIRASSEVEPMKEEEKKKTKWGEILAKWASKDADAWVSLNDLPEETKKALCD